MLQQEQSEAFQPLKNTPAENSVPCKDALRYKENTEIL